MCPPKTKLVALRAFDKEVGRVEAVIVGRRGVSRGMTDYLGESRRIADDRTANSRRVYTMWKESEKHLRRVGMLKTHASAGHLGFAIR